jgi:predicted MFS family arabinose efflux permease
MLLRTFGFSAGDTFGALLVASVAGGCTGLAICALIGEAVERRTSIVVSACLFCGAMYVLYCNHGLVAAFILSAVAWGTMTVWLFNMYNHTTLSYPTRLRATGVGLTNGLGRLGSVFGPLIAGVLFAGPAFSSHAGWYLYVTIPGALLPAALIGWRGIDQRRAILEQISG